MRLRSCPFQVQQHTPNTKWLKATATIHLCLSGSGLRGAGLGSPGPPALRGWLGTHRAPQARLVPSLGGRGSWAPVDSCCVHTSLSFSQLPARASRLQGDWQGMEPGTKLDCPPAWPGLPTAFCPPLSGLHAHTVHAGQGVDAGLPSHGEQHTLEEHASLACPLLSTAAVNAGFGQTMLILANTYSSFLKEQQPLGSGHHVATNW